MPAAFAYACGQCFLEIAIHELISEKVVGSSLNYYNIVEVERMLEENEFHLFGNRKKYLPLIFPHMRTMATWKNIFLVGDSEGKYSYAKKYLWEPQLTMPSNSTCGTPKQTLVDEHACSCSSLGKFDYVSFDTGGHLNLPYITNIQTKKYCMSDVNYLPEAMF